MGVLVRRSVLVVAAVASAVSGSAVAAPSASASTTVNVSVPGTAGGNGHGGTPPVASGVVLDPSRIAVVTASGTVYLAVPSDAGGLPNGPAGGNPGGAAPAGSGSLVPSSPYGCLNARVGTGAWRCIGAGPTVLTGTGEVQLAVNDGLYGAGGVPGYADNSGQFRVSIVVGSTYPPDVRLPNVRSNGSTRHRR